MNSIITSFIKIKKWNNEQINSLGHFLAYDVKNITHFNKGEDRVEKVYNHCFNATPDPHYYASYCLTLYALSPQPMRLIEVNGRKIRPDRMTWQENNMRHVLVKVLYSAMFERYSQAELNDKGQPKPTYKNPLINNTDVYVQISTSTWPDDKGINREWVYTMRSPLNQHYRQPDLFVLSDGLMRFKSIHKNDEDLPSAVYTTINFGGLKVMCRVKPKEVRGLLKKGDLPLFMKVPGTVSKRIKKSFFDDRNLKNCKAYYIHRMSELIVTYLDNLGIEAEVWKPSTIQLSINKNFATQKWVDFADKPLYLVDGRLRHLHPHLQPAAEPVEFSAQLQQMVIEAIVNLRGSDDLKWLPQHIIPLPFGTQPPNPPSDMVMVLSDNNKKDWQVPDATVKPEIKAGLLYGIKDVFGNPIGDIYEVIKQHYPSSQVVIVHDEKSTVATKKKKSESKNPDEDADEENITPEKYLNYGLPYDDEHKVVKDFLLNKLPNCFYRWAVKDMVMQPQGVTSRYPLIGLAEKMKDTIFVFQTHHLMFLAEGNLHFEDFYLANGDTEVTNPEFSKVIYDRTGWNFGEIIASVRKKRYENHKNPDTDKETESQKESSSKLPKANLMINRNFVIEILQYPQFGGRLIPDMAAMVGRMNDLAETVPLDSLLCGNSDKEKKLFNRRPENFSDIAVAINQFLNQKSKNGEVSLAILKGSDAAKDLYPVLKKLLEYSHAPHLSTLINRYIGLKRTKKLGSQRVIPGGDGFLFIPGHNMYHLAISGKGKVEKWFKFYEVIPHCTNDVNVDQLIQHEILPMLEVPFIRYKRQTVIPFPFNFLKEKITLN